MNEFLNIVISICETFLVTELIISVFPEEKALRFCVNIVTVFIFVSLIMNFGSFENVFNFEIENIDTEETAESIYISETERLISERVETALNSVYIECDGISSRLKINGEGEINMDTLIIDLKYKSDAERANIVIRELFKYSPNFKIEVISDG